MTSATSKPVPVGTPPPSPPPGGPSGPTPTGPPRGSAALVADVESQLSAPLHTLVAGVLDDDVDTVTRAYLDEAAHHVSEALRVLARIETPAHRDPNQTPGFAVVTPGGPDKPDSEGDRAGGVIGVSGAVGGFTLPPIPTVASFDNGPQYDALPSVQTGSADYRVRP